MRSSSPYGAREHSQEEGEIHWSEERDFRIPLNDTFFVNFEGSFDDQIPQSQLLLPQISPSWSNFVAAESQWSADISFLSRPNTEFGGAREAPFNASQNPLNFNHSVGIDVNCFEQPHVYPLPPIPLIGQRRRSVNTYHAQHQCLLQDEVSTPLRSSVSSHVEYADQAGLLAHPTHYIQNPAHLWTQPSPQFTWHHLGVETTSQRPPLPQLVLDWSTSEQSSESANSVGPTAVLPKRKTSSGGLTKKRHSKGTPQLSECIDVFEHEPGALASLKRRKKLDAPVRKAAREVRKAGACHQCRFRKRTVSGPSLQSCSFANRD